MIGTTNCWRRYLRRANLSTWSACHFRPPQRLRRLAESSRKTASSALWCHDWNWRILRGQFEVEEARCRVLPADSRGGCHHMGAFLAADETTN